MNQEILAMPEHTAVRNELGQGIRRHAGHERNLRVHFAQALLRNILHSASQGLGIGAVLTYVEMLNMGAIHDNGRINVDHGIFTALVENAAAGRHWLEAFENILAAFQKEYVCQSLDAHSLSRELTQVVQGVEKFRRIKNQWLSLDPVSYTGKIRANTEGFHEVMSELLLNAFKYSPANSRIRILCCSTEKLVSFMIVNEVETMRGGVTGLPAEYQRKIFEPFFRLNNTWDDRFREQRFGLGIGLTLAENIANACGGQLYTYEIELPNTENSGLGTSSKRVVSELVLEKTALA